MLNKRTGTIHPYVYDFHLNYGRPLVALRAGKGRDIGQLHTAPLSVVFHSLRLISRRAIISRNGLEARMCFLERARAEHSR